MTLSTFQQVKDALVVASKLTADKSGSSGSSAVVHRSYWTAEDATTDNTVWAAGATPTAAETVSKATVGAGPIPNVLTGNTLYLAGIRMASFGGLSGENEYAVAFADRLVQSGGLSGVVTTAQSVNTPALPRYTSGEGVYGWLEVYTAVGSTQVVASISYTNQAGVSGRTGTCPFGGSSYNTAASLIPIKLQQGDTGIRSIESVTLSATTATAGNFGVTLGKPFAFGYRPDTRQTFLDWMDLGLPIVDSNACTWVYTLPNSGRSYTVFAFDWIQG